THTHNEHRPQHTHTQTRAVYINRHTQMVTVSVAFELLRRYWDAISLLCFTLFLHHCPPPTQTPTHTQTHSHAYKHAQSCIQTHTLFELILMQRGMPFHMPTPASCLHPPAGSCRWHRPTCTMPVSTEMSGITTWGPHL